MATSAFRANGVQVTNLVTCPVSAAAAGLWWDGNTTGPKWRKADGTDVTLGAGGGSTGNWTFAGNDADLIAPGVMGLGITNTTSYRFYKPTLTLAPNAIFNQSSQSATNTIALALQPNVADGASSVLVDINSTTTLANAAAALLRIRNNGTTLLNTVLNSTDGVSFVDGGGSAKLQLSSTTGSSLAYGLSFWKALNTRITATDSTGTIDLFGGNLTLTIFQGTADADGTRDWGLVGTRWRRGAFKRLIQGSQNLSFSATPAFDATLGNMIHLGPVTANITGPTMAAGEAGEFCTIVFLKDATAGTYSISGWGSNTRTAGTLTFTSGASSLVTITFRWDDRLSTAAWVETSRSAFN